MNVKQKCFCYMKLSLILNISMSLSELLLNSCSLSCACEKFNIAARASFGWSKLVKVTWDWVLHHNVFIPRAFVCLFLETQKKEFMEQWEEEMLISLFFFVFTIYANCYCPWNNKICLEKSRLQDSTGSVARCDARVSWDQSSHFSPYVALLFT